MRRTICFAACLTLSAAALAQAPAPSKGPSQERAQKAAKAAIAACKGVPVAVAVLDDTALPKLIVVSDGTSNRMADFARRKATTALRFGKPSAEVRDAAKDSPDLAAQLRTDPALIGFGGGLLVKGGAVAVAGAPSQDTDVRCAMAAKAVLDK
jgi:uncharacterized protein GlcG (DUF336 family)